ncbi:Uncharacterised protein [Vibrio cholerae]|nr:Uncharacterised protein [Vibrio cholerae]
MALEVRELNHIIINQCDVADPRSREVLATRAAQTTRTEDQHRALL